MKQLALSVIVIFIGCISAFSQNGGCTALGQNPETAFPVCGTSEFHQLEVPICNGPFLEVPTCGGYTARNPFWYRFTCFKAGTLDFSILPISVTDDYDWQLYDITGHNPEDVLTDNSLIVTGNWSGSEGATGADASGVPYIQCGSNPTDHTPTFSKPPTLLLNHVYILMVSHFTSTQSGYYLKFNGGSASITDTTVPGVKNAFVNCEGNEITVRLNKKMKCSSLAADGSDFSLNATGVTIVSASAVSCSTGFDMDSITLTLSTNLQAGSYTIQSKTGNDNNTLLDNCDNALAENTGVTLTVLTKQPTPFDSIVPPTCSPNILELVFKKPIRCSSIAEDGSDFTIEGNSTVAIKRAYGNCNNNGESTSIFLHLSEPITTGGLYTVQLQNGIDGNSIIDACGEETPALERVTFVVKDAVSAKFSATLLYGCRQDTILLSHDGNHSVSSWLWTMSGNITRSTQKSEIIYDSYGEKAITLVVSNGFCSDTATTTMVLDNELRSMFNMPELSCPDEPVLISDSSIGNIISYHWNFGNGMYSAEKNPSPPFYSSNNGDKKYTISLITENNLHCFDTLTKTLTIVTSCHIAVPSAFTPNGDGINDYLFPLNAYTAQNLLFIVYDRLGKIVFKTNDWSKKWDGTFKGQPQPSGTYIWQLQFKALSSGELVNRHGTTVLIR